MILGTFENEKTIGSVVILRVHPLTYVALEPPQPAKVLRKASFEELKDYFYSNNKGAEFEHHCKFWGKPIEPNWHIYELSVD